MFSKFRAKGRAPSSPLPPQSPVHYQQLHVGNVPPSPEMNDTGDAIAWPRTPFKIEDSSSSHAPVLPPIRRVASQQKSDDEVLASLFNNLGSFVARDTNDEPRSMLQIGQPEIATKKDTRQEIQPSMMASEERASPASPKQKLLDVHPAEVATACGPTSLITEASPEPTPVQFARSASSGNIMLDLPSISSAPSTPKLSRARNLLHPRSLLMRRRTTQGLDAFPDETQPDLKTFDVPAMNLPDDYDPRIRGRVIHDFNAPRPRRNFSANDVQGPSTQAGPLEPPEFARRTSIPMLTVGGLESVVDTQAIGNAEESHLPNIKEAPHSEADLATRSSATQRETLAKRSHLAEPSPSLGSESHNLSTSSAPYSQAPIPPLDTSTSPLPLPTLHTSASLSRKTQTSHTLMDRLIDRTSKSTRASSSRVSGGTSSAHRSESNGSRASSTSRTGETPSRISTMQHTSYDADSRSQSCRIPKYSLSNNSKSSRFSFQVNGDRSAEQERAMEAKHAHAVSNDVAFDREGALRGGAESRSISDLSDSDDGYFASHQSEEDVPGVNTDSLEERQHAALSSQLPTEIHDLAVTGYLESRKSVGAARHDESVDTRDTAKPITTLSISTPPTEISQTRPEPKRRQHTISDHDLYFDDGVIADHDQDGGDEIVDEDVLDNLDGPAMDRYKYGRSKLTHGALEMRSRGEPIETDGDMRPDDLRVDAFDAYHQALATAASQAAADGKFQRLNSLGISYDSDVANNDSAAMDMDSPRKVQALEGSCSSFLPSESSRDAHSKWDDDDDDDDDMDDMLGEEDPMIAAANAEALAADDVDFYGREFGFYSRPATSDAALYAGGYFGRQLEPSDGRAHHVVKDPNLTPITERSEFSTRNSFIGAVGSGGVGLLSSSNPRDTMVTSGLGELAEQVEHEDAESDISFERLLKLRKGAFGADSSPGLPGHGHSPRSHASALIPQAGGHASRSPNQDLHSGALSLPALAPSTRGSVSTTTTTRTTCSTPKHATSFMPDDRSVPPPSSLQLSKFSGRPQASSTTPAALLSPVAVKQEHEKRLLQPRLGDSVTYVRQERADGREEWYVEKRRTLETGVVVVLGRELVEGGRI